MKNILIATLPFLLAACAGAQPAPDYLIVKAEKNAPVAETAFIVNSFRTPEKALERSKKQADRPFGWKPSEEEKKQPLEVDANIKHILNIGESDAKPFSVGSNRQLHYSANYVEVKPGMYQVDITCLINNKFASIKVMTPALAGQTTYIKCEMPNWDATTVRATAAEINDTDPNIRNWIFSYK